MKPIQLTWSGLQSYREKQDIDFTLLCDAGVFGIFGPTGSGKSTILDAITLALYGKVERASNGTQGILNQAENTLTVSFTFELSHAEGAKKYRVERQFKRAADVSVTNTICRLIQIQTEQNSVVVADKAGEVNAQILQILGLSMQDFSRAVILPQGKFAEFLSLKGTDRRQMLQRLFHLEHYGDVLNARVSQRTKETDVVIKQIVAEQLGLGDASEQALFKAKQQLEEAQNNAKQKRIELQQTMKQWEGMKQLRIIELEQQELETKRFDLVSQEERIASQELQLKCADQAERVRHFLEEYETTNAHQHMLVLQQAQLALQFNELTTQTDRVIEQHAQAHNELSNQDAPLQVKLEQLKQAVIMEQDILKVQLQGDELSAKHESCKQQVLLSQDELLKKQDIHTRALKKQADLNEQLRSMEVKADYRQRLQHALRDKQAQDAAQMKTSDLLQQMTDKQQLLTIEKLRESELNRQLNNNQSLLMTLLHAVKGNALIHSQTELGLENLILGVTSAIEKLKQADKSREIERFALHLADQLQEQHPCPVCGSLEHPSPAFLTEASAVSISTSSELERHELLRSKAQKLQFNQVRQVMQQQALEQKLIEVLPFVSNRETAEAEAAAAISAISLDSTRFESVDSLEQEYDRITEQLKLNGYNMANLAEEMKQALQQKDHSIQQQMEALAQIQAIQTQKDGIEMQLSTAQKEYAHQQEQWKITYPMLSFDHIQLESDKLNEQDQAAEQLRLRVEQSIPFIEEVFKEIQYNMLEITELDKQKVQLETEYKGLQKQSIELQSQFKTRWEHEIKAGGTITGYIQETEQQLKQLRESERLTRQQMEISQKELFQLNEQYVTLRQAADSAQQAFMKAEQFWKEALKQTSFLTADEVKGALISSDQIEKWQQEVRQYRELSVRLTAKVEELKTKLNGQSVSETQWSEIEIMLVKARELDELALQDRAKMERDLEQLQSKHSHWCELEQNLSRHKQEFADLSKLQSVLRGNAFVEYIAEEQLIQVCRIASERLGQLTRQRYALEVDSSGGFIIRDDANGGVRRPVSTLSGGETFLTSLALALALSAQIQLSGQYPLEFFFLDEGFGTLDPELLETVVEALEKLHIDRLTVGIISHVPELKARLPRKIIVESAEPGGRGSRVIIEGL